MAWQRKPVLDAQQYIISEEETTSEESSMESVYFSGTLHDERIVLIDSSGINSTIYQKHGDITEKMIASGNFDMVLYIINYTADSTDTSFAEKTSTEQNQELANLTGKSVEMLTNVIAEMCTYLRKVSHCRSVSGHVGYCCDQKYKHEDHSSASGRTRQNQCREIDCIG